MSGNYVTPDTGSWFSPTIAQNPGLASDVINSTTPPQVTSDVLSQSSNVVTAQDAVVQHAQNNQSSGFWSHVAGAGWNTLNFLAKPLQEVQRDYKFIHSVYADHGILPGLLATLGVAGGGIAGTLLGPVGTAIGADLAATGIRKIFGSTYQDSYNKSEDPNYKISFGRDTSNLLGTISDAIGATGIGAALKNTNKGLGAVVSGSVDISGDIVADPMMVLGKANAMMKMGRMIEAAPGTSLGIQAKYPLMRVIPGVENFLASHSLRAMSAEQLDAVRKGGLLNVQSSGYNRALDAIAQIGKDAKTTILQAPGSTPADLAAGRIAQVFPQYGTEAAGRLGTIVTQDLPKKIIADQIHDFNKMGAYFSEQNNMMSSILPSRTLLHPATTIVDYMRDNPIKPVNWLYKTFSGYMPFSIDQETGQMSAKEFNYKSPDALKVIYRSNKFSQSDQYANEIAGQYATAIAAASSSPELSLKGLNTARQINAQSTMDMLKAAGLPDDNRLVIRVKNIVDGLNSEEPMGAGIYGFSPLPTVGNLSDYTTVSGEHANAALWEHQTSDLLPIPNYREIKRELLTLGTIKNKLGQLDDFVIDPYTDKMFKPLALATAGFGLRVAASELILATSRFGIKPLIAAKIATNAAQRGYDVLPKEVEHLQASTLTGLGVGKGMDDTMKKGIYPIAQRARARGLKYLANMSGPELYDVAQHLAEDGKGSVLQDSISSAGHSGAAADSYDAEQNTHKIFMKTGIKIASDGRYTTFTPDSPDFLGRYATQLAKASVNPAQKNIAADIGWVFRDTKKVNPSVNDSEFMSYRNRVIDQEQQRILDAKAGTNKTYSEGVQSLDRFINQNPREFAADRVDAMLGLFIGQDGTVHHNLIDSVANNLTVKSVAEKTASAKKLLGDTSKLPSNINRNILVKNLMRTPDDTPTGINALKQIPQDSLPAKVAGMSVGQPIVDANSILSRVISQGFKKVFNPIINNMSREPLYVTHVAEEYGALKNAVSKGMLTDEQSWTIAKTRAAHAMLPEIHNPMLKNQMSVMARNFFPFYFAQEQAWKRTISAMKETSVLSPAFSRTVREFQMIEQMMADPTFVTSDSNGNKYMNMPIVGEFGQNLQSALQHFGVPMVSGLPISVSGSLSSLKSVVPEMNKLPGVSPIVAIPLNFVSDLIPAWQPAISGALGQSASRGMWDTINPNTFSKTVWQALTLDEKNSAVSNAIFGALASAYYHGDPGFNAQASAGDKRDLIERIRGNARSILAMKAALNLLSPLAPKVEQVDQGLRDEFLKLVQEKGDYVSALNAFIAKEGTKAIGYTISKTTASVKGATFPYVQESMDWINSHKNIIHDQPGKPPTSTGAAFLIPQNPGKTDHSLAIFNDLMQQHLRAQIIPQDFITQLYISEADQYIAPLEQAHKDAIAQATANQDTTALANENANWSGVMAKMTNLYPDWWKLYSKNAGQTNASVALSQLRTIFAMKNAPTNDQSNMVRVLVQGYDYHMQQINAAKQAGDTQGTKDENANWTSYLDSVVQNDPRLKPVVTTVFKKLG